MQETFCIEHSCVTSLALLSKAFNLEEHDQTFM
jgi:hypothetical protein